MSDPVTGRRRRFLPTFLDCGRAPEACAELLHEGLPHELLLIEGRSRTDGRLAQGFSGWDPPETATAVPVDELTVHEGV